MRIRKVYCCVADAQNAPQIRGIIAQADIDEFQAPRIKLIINWYLCNVNVFSYAVLDHFRCGRFLSSFRFLLSSSPTSHRTLLSTDKFEVPKRLFVGPVFMDFSGLAQSPTQERYSRSYPSPCIRLCTDVRYLFHSFRHAT
jgi:hypothetical protein